MEIEILIRQPNRNIKFNIGYMDLDFREKNVLTSDRHLEVINL